MTRNAPKLWVLIGAIAIVPPPLRAQGSPAPVPAPAPETPAPPPAPPVDVRATRLFFAPTARALPRGEGSVALTEIVFPSVEVGVSSRLSVGAFGIPPLDDLGSGGVVLASKAQILRHGHVQAAVGVFQAFGSGETGGIGYGVVTVGSDDSALTVGYGYGYGHVADSEGSPGVLFVGADKSIGRSVRLIVEGYIGGVGMGLPAQTLLGGVRFSRRRWSVDLGAVLPIYETGTGTPFPILAVAWAF